VNVEKKKEKETPKENRSLARSLGTGGLSDRSQATHRIVFHTRTCIIHK